MQTRSQTLLLALFTLGVGVTIGYGVRASRNFSEAVTSLAENSVMQVAEAPVEDRCRKSEELYGQVLLAALAQLGSRLTPAAQAQLEKSAAGATEPAPRPSENAKAEVPKNLAVPVPSPPFSAWIEEPSPVAAPEPAVAPSDPVAAPSAPGRAVPTSLARVRIIQDDRGCLAKRPDWFVEEAGTQEYDVRISGRGGREDQRELRIQNHAGQSGVKNVRVSGCLQPVPRVQTRVTFTAELQVSSNSIRGQVALRAEARDRSRLAENIRDFRHGQKWTPFTLELEAPEETRALEFNVSVQGAGTVQMRNPQWRTR